MKHQPNVGTVLWISFFLLMLLLGWLGGLAGYFVPRRWLEGRP